MTNGFQLTTTRVAKIKAGAKLAKYDDGNGLRLYVYPSGARAWVLRVQIKGKRPEFGLGSYPTVGLGEARDRARDKRRELQTGTALAVIPAAPVAVPVLPFQPQQVLRGPETATAIDGVAIVSFAGGITFREATEKAHKGVVFKSDKLSAAWLSRMERYAFPKFGADPAAAVTSAQLHDVLNELWLTKRETARKLIAAFAVIFNWLEAQGVRSDDPLAKAKKGLSKAPQKRSNFAALHFNDVPAFVRELREFPGMELARLMLEFTVLTAKRSGEVRGAKWAELSRDMRTWTIPGERMKMGKPHREPLADRAVAILKRARELGNGSDYVFPSTKGGEFSDMTMLLLLKRNGYAEYTVHGFRSACRGWCASRKVPEEVAELILAHGNPDQVGAAYQREDLLELRRPVMEAWADHVLGAPALAAAA